MNKVLFSVVASMLFAASADAMDWQYASYSDPMTDAVKEVAGGTDDGKAVVFSCWSGKLVVMVNTGEFVGDSRRNGPSDGEVYYSYRVGQEQAVMRKTANLSSDNKTLVVTTDEAQRIALGFFRSPIMFQLADYNGIMIRFVFHNDDAENALRKLSCAGRYFPPVPTPPVANPISQPEGSGSI